MKEEERSSPSQSPCWKKESPQPPTHADKNRKQSIKIFIIIMKDLTFSISVNFKDRNAFSRTFQDVSRTKSIQGHFQVFQEEWEPCGIGEGKGCRNRPGPKLKSTIPAFT